MSIYFTLICRFFFTKDHSEIKSLYTKNLNKINPIALYLFHSEFPVGSYKLLGSSTICTTLYATIFISTTRNIVSIQFSSQNKGKLPIGATPLTDIDGYKCETSKQTEMQTDKSCQLSKQIKKYTYTEYRYYTCQPKTYYFTKKNT